MPKSNEREDLLRSVPLFEGLSRKELKSVAAEMRESWFNAGDNIVTEGKKGAGFYIIAEGSAKVIVGSRARRTLAPGDSFGEMSLLDTEPRSATVQATTRVRTLGLSSLNFLRLMEDNWAMTRKIMSELCRRIRALESSHLH